MRIDPASLPPAGTQAALPPDADPQRPFEDFLGGGAAGARASGFAELGMFGRERPVEVPAPAGPAPKGNPLLETAAAILPVESLDQPVDRPAAPSPAPVTILAEPGQRPSAVSAIPEVAPRAAAGPDPSAAPGLAVSPSEPAPAGEEAAPAAAAARRADRPQAPRSDVSLVMTEKDGEVELVAGGPALDPEACALLRRLVRAILARNGLNLAQFHLNGVRLAADSTIMTGGSHGTRSH